MEFERASRITEGRCLPWYARPVLKPVDLPRPCATALRRIIDAR